MKMLRTSVVAFLLVTGVLGSSALALNMETVPVGNLRNAGELSGAGAGGYGPDGICGSVDYLYNIGKYEVTAGQYTEFLNAVAKTDTYGLYNANMWSNQYGCKIQQNGTSGSYTYSVSSDWANRPANYVSYWDSCRFANWLHNGQGNGDTETGAYTLTTNEMNNNTVTRNTDWKWAVTSEDEWYKAAYYDTNKSGGAGYWDYPTSSDVIEPGMANYLSNYTTDVGTYSNHPSAYGTYDQGGNVQEWNEAVPYTSYRGLRGGSFLDDGYSLLASGRGCGGLEGPAYESYGIGFRVVEVPEPTTLLILALGGLGMLRRYRGLGS